MTLVKKARALVRAHCVSPPPDAVLSKTHQVRGCDGSSVSCAASSRRNVLVVRGVVAGAASRAAGNRRLHFAAPGRSARARTQDRQLPGRLRSRSASLARIIFEPAFVARLPHHIPCKMLSQHASRSPQRYRARTPGSAAVETESVPASHAASRPASRNCDSTSAPGTLASRRA